MSKKQEVVIPADKLGDVPENGPKDWFQVIEPPTSLHKKAVLPGVSNPGMDEELLAKAEQALEELSENFNDWMKDEINALISAKEKAGKQPTDETFEALYHASHNVKGQAHTLGYPLAGLAAASLCRLIDNLPDKFRLPMSLVDHHVLAISAIVRENVKDMENKTACALLDRLEEVAEDFLEQEKARAEKQDVA